MFRCANISSCAKHSLTRTHPNVLEMDVITSALPSPPSFLHLSYNDLDRISILHTLIASDLLAFEASRRAPDAGAATSCAHFFVYFRGNIRHCCSWLHGQWFLVHLFVVAQVNAD